MTEIFGLEEIVTLYEDGWEIKHSTDPEYRGLCDPGEYIIYLYTNNIETEHEYNVTLIHEFLHAHDCTMSEALVERKAYEIVDHFPEVIDFIKDLYRIENEK